MYGDFKVAPDPGAKTCLNLRVLQLPPWAEALILLLPGPRQAATSDTGDRGHATQRSAILSCCQRALTTEIGSVTERTADCGRACVPKQGVLRRQSYEAGAVLVRGKAATWEATR